MGIQILLAIVAIIVLWLNVRATVVICVDELSEPAQRWVQLLMVWVLPLVGSIIVLAVHRKEENPSRKYRKADGDVDDIEDFDTGIAGSGDAADAD